ncbi:TetR/AcrR family transcriptional regulator C-terminal domain-containing protein [Micromonospora sp. DR5-3]|uniref:TetR/AcrR family transcriptional regulator n=1 Tax=unclassified Micromonospora TaxID=2617518 RepID=UPI0011D8BE68|nr:MULTISPECIES: TetR/AcrR family transcriptional regulator C-terminal domain-containing protein [unclassified Micromonospora]MCW3820265.1 TetR/AcrR family transcriptional regulator C-terminal domain-containing protein [Micromonospora sp. DR5-3]TYC16360.1 TetR family transcriptional regulator [Micromonospora sp. MP36]
MAEMLRRAPLSRDRILLAAVALADEAGIESLSMRNLAQDLGVVPMALYKHVANKDELLDGMIDMVVSEIGPPVPDADWKRTVRRRILSARQVLRRHPWAPLAIESRNMATPAILAYLDSMVGTFRAGGLSADLAHHVMHAMGSRILGFSQELFDASRRAGRSGTTNPDPPAALPPEAAARFPHLAEIAMAASHDNESVVGQGCDDQFEFEFALDLLLDGIERLHQQAWTSSRRLR